MSSAEVAVDLHVSELMEAGHEVAESRETLLAEFRSAQIKQQVEFQQWSELRAQQTHALNNSSEELSL
eukprot:2737252-Amphidinium_carterae.2